MNHHDIKARVGTSVSAEEMAEMIKSMPIGSAASDARLHSGVLSFSFGREVILTGMEERIPKKDQPC